MTNIKPMPGTKAQVTLDEDGLVTFLNWHITGHEPITHWTQPGLAILNHLHDLLKNVEKPTDPQEELLAALERVPDQREDFERLLALKLSIPMGGLPQGQQVVDLMKLLFAERR